MALSVGIGLTNDCNLSCAHCYRPTDQIYHLTMQDVKDICENLPVGSMGLGTGENGLHPQFLEIVDYLLSQDVKLTMASNSYSLNTIPDHYLRSFHDLEVSIDFPTERDQDLFRGQGNWRDVHAAIDRCQGLGIEASILATMMNTNYHLMGDLARLARERGLNLRVNAYQPVQNDHFALSYEQFWEGYRQLLGAAKLLSCSEPVLMAVLGIEPVRSPCGHQSIRVTPQRRIAPCVYWPSSSLTILDATRLGERLLETTEFELATQVPPSAQDCACQGGCASRRALLGKLDAHDAYCPWVRGDEIHLEFEWAPEKELLRGKNYCTTIVM